MKRPTLDILDAIDGSYQQYQGIKPINARLNEYTNCFFLDNQSWDNYFAKIKDISFSWKEIKYSDVVNKKVSIDIDVPKQTGVYIFIVKPNDVVYNLPGYVYYVGIAGAGLSGRTLDQRLHDYFHESHLKKRDAIRILIFKHYNNIYIAYSPVKLSIGVTLEEVEKSLIGFFGTHILANRDDIPIDLKPQTKAFNI